MQWRAWHLCLQDGCSRSMNGVVAIARMETWRRACRRCWCHRQRDDLHADSIKDFLTGHRYRRTGFMFNERLMLVRANAVRAERNAKMTAIVSTQISTRRERTQGSASVGARHHPARAHFATSATAVVCEQVATCRMRTRGSADAGARQHSARADRATSATAAVCEQAARYRMRTRRSTSGCARQHPARATY